MKKTVLFMGILISTFLAATTYASEGVLYEGQTYVPLRGAFEELGFTVEWDQSIKHAVISDEEYKLRIIEGVPVFYIIGTGSFSSPEPLRIGDTLYIPLRAIGESIGATISWNGESKIAHIFYNGRDSYVHCKSYAGAVQQNTTAVQTATQPASTYPDTNIPEFGLATGLGTRGDVYHQGNSHAYTYTFRNTYNEMANAIETIYMEALKKAGYYQDGAESLARTEQLITQMPLRFNTRFIGAAYVYKNNSGAEVMVILSDTGSLMIMYNTN